MSAALALPDTRERLLCVAMHLFALHGIDGVALKTISDAAGNRNKSAVGYHFASKRGLVEAVLERLHDDLAPPMIAVLDAVEARLDHGEEVLIDAVVLDLLTPILRLYAGTGYGPDGVRVLARIMHDPLDEVPPRIRASIAQVSRRTIAVLRRLLPRKRKADLRHHVHHALMATVNGLALRQQFLRGAGPGWKEEPLAEMFLSYVGYVVAGLAAGPLNLGPAAIAAWLAQVDQPHMSTMHGEVAWR